MYKSSTSFSSTSNLVKATLFSILLLNYHLMVTYLLENFVVIWPKVSARLAFFCCVHHHHVHPLAVLLLNELVVGAPCKFVNSCPIVRLF